QSFRRVLETSGRQGVPVGRPEHSAAEAPAAEGELLRFNDDGSGPDGQLVFAEPESELGVVPITPCARCGESTPAPRSRNGNGGASLTVVCPQCREAMAQNDERIPGYRWIRDLGRGGMGQVWLGQHYQTGEQVAVKTLLPEVAVDRQARVLFLREARLSLQLDHPHIVGFRDDGEYDGQLYLVMEFVPGLNAEELRERHRGRLPAPLVCQLGLQSLQALEHAHGRGIVHRDLKPPNLLLRQQGRHYEVKLTDFGLAKNYRDAGMSQLTQRGEVRGSVPFMPPEQVLDCRGVDHRADIFGLGATLYHLVCGQFVYNFSPPEERDPFVTIIEDDTIPLERRGVDVPRPLRQVIQRAIEKDRGRRYQTAAEMREALERAA
ncbi:MAG: hypothetical protein COZ06_37305, partial [Armatimonadetes bacterium CG_4_10_14_3_um_filter_66_18]